MFLLLILTTFFSLTSEASLIEEGILVQEENLRSLRRIPQEYEAVAIKVQKLFQEELNREKATLKINYELKSTTVNASASREGSEWRINFYGGLLKHKSFDVDVFSIFLCHELGHHLAGSPFKFYPDSKWSWISAEGQADYFVTNICLKKLLQNENNALYLSGKQIPEEAKLGCNYNFANPGERSLCLRSILMSQKMASFLHSLKRARRAPKHKRPVLSEPDTTIVASTYTMHPTPQCRLDTFYQGAICSLYYSNISEFNCLETEDGNTGARPRCWYFPEN